MSFKDYLDADEEKGLYLPSPQHAFNAGRCMHCGCDDHSLPAQGEKLATWEKPCKVGYEDRQTVWSFGPDQLSTDKGSVIDDV